MTFKAYIEYYLLFKGWIKLILNWHSSNEELEQLNSNYNEKLDKCKSTTFYLKISNNVRQIMHNLNQWVQSWNFAQVFFIDEHLERIFEIPPLTEVVWTKILCVKL